MKSSTSIDTEKAAGPIQASRARCCCSSSHAVSGSQVSNAMIANGYEPSRSSRIPARISIAERP